MKQKQIIGSVSFLNEDLEESCHLRNWGVVDGIDVVFLLWGQLEFQKGWIKKTCDKWFSAISGRATSC